MIKPSRLLKQPNVLYNKVSIFRNTNRKLTNFYQQNLVYHNKGSKAMQKDQAILSMFKEYFKSFQNTDYQRFLKYDPEATVILSNINETLYNSICIKNPINNEKLIEEIKGIQQSLGKPLTAWITSETNSAGLEQMLKDKFESPGRFYGMLLDLNEVNLSPISKKITIESVRNISQAQDYARVFCEVFHFPNMLNDIEQWVIKQYEMDTPVCINYLAKIDGMLAGTSALTINRGFNELKTGGFYNAGVIPKFRKSGIGTAMACHRIHAARELGLDYLSIVLMSDAMARGYCERLGFKNYQPMTPYFIK